MSHVSLLVAGEMAGGEDPHVAAERSIAPWNKMEGTRPCGEKAVLCRERRLTATTDVTHSNPRQSSQSTLPNVNKYALGAFLFTNPQTPISSTRRKTLHL